MDLSFVIAVYNEEGSIKELHARILQAISVSYEIIFIDDGSEDRSAAIIEEIQKKDKNVKLIQFQRNFGKSAALNCGFGAAKGDIVFTMDGDLQDDPKEIPKFIDKLNQGYDVVVGWKHKRRDPFAKTIPSKFFNKLTALTTGVRIHDANCGFKAFKKKVIEHITVYGELHRYIPAIAHWKGFRVGEVKVEHHPRIHGKSKYGVERLLKGFFDLLTVKFLTTYVRRPLHFFGALGGVCGILGVILGIYLVFAKLFLGASLANRPLLLLAVLLVVLSAIFISLGLVAELVTSQNNQDDYVIKEK